jgi:hypothetical protein
MSTDASDEITAAFRFHIMRYEDRYAWRAKARSGGETANICLWAAENWMKDLPTEHSVCPCCHTVFSPTDVPRAFIVLIPVETDPERVKARAAGVCAECCKHDDQWLVAQGLGLTGLAPTTARPGDRVH